jgi:peptide methionine sulfoxide reductase msrA/msrB
MRKFEKKENDSELKKRLSKIEYDVTQNSATEAPFTSEYYSSDEKGLYVDVVTGEPLFLSIQKFDSGCGWPSFSKPIKDDFIEYNTDTTYNMKRTEVRSKIGDSHLGHVFDDGPKEMGGLRYCINGASLRFIPFEDLEKEGYEEYIKLFNQ